MEANERYSRHILLNEVGTKGQEALNNAKVLVVGAGGLGCPVLQYLTAAGVGTIGIVDGDVVSLSNLQRQILYKENEIGIPKTTAAINTLKGLNSDINFIEYKLFLNSENILSIISRYDIVIDGSDNFSTRYLVSDACIIAGKPLVFGSISKFEGQVSVFNYNNGPSYRCLFPEPPQNIGNCSTEGVLGILPGIVGTQMASEAIKLILGIGEVLSGKLKIINVLTNTELYLTVQRNEANFKRINLEKDYAFNCEDEEILQVSADELKQWISNKEVQIVDVREVDEFEIYHIEGSLNIPLSEIEIRQSEIAPNIKTVVLCAGGVRSIKAIKQLNNFSLYNLEGGINHFKLLSSTN